METSRFFEACRTGNLSLFTSLAKKQPENIVANGCYAAAKEGHANIVRSSLRHGAVVDDILVTMAAQGKSIEVFQVLKEYGWKANDLGIFGQPILPLVVENQDLLLWLLDQGVDPNQLAGNNCSSAIHRDFAGAAIDAAAACGSLAAVDLLIERGAAREEAHPLHAAAGSISQADGELIPMIAHLIAWGFDLNKWENRGPGSKGRPLHHAMLAGNVKTAQFLRDHGAVCTAKHQ